MKIVVLTGAGVSADSGVSTFRDPDGVWAKYDVNEVATPEGFLANPALVHEFYNGRRLGLKTVAPNPAHFALAKLEKTLEERAGELTLVTQNVDDLHERGGSKSVIHMHGELTRVRCEHCGNIASWTEELSVETQCPSCDNAGAMRPHIVWFGEMPMYMNQIEEALQEADQFVSIGTSGSVYPAAGYVAMARTLGIPCTELNLEPSENASMFTNYRYGAAADIVPQWVESVIDG